MKTDLRDTPWGQAVSCAVRSFPNSLYGLSLSVTVATEDLRKMEDIKSMHDVEKISAEMGMQFEAIRGRGDPDHDIEKIFAWYSERQRYSPLAALTVGFSIGVPWADEGAKTLRVDPDAPVNIQMVLYVPPIDPAAQKASQKVMS
jgi:hypothetical protein